VTVAVFDVRGQRVRTIGTERFVADTATFTWDGTTETGDEAPSGIYFARVMSGSGDVAIQKVVRVR
jgi:flagellar hook assembly protein FlgD